MAVELKPCPFCGGTNLASPPGQAVIVCGDCDATGPMGTAHPTNDTLTHAAGASKWNQRADDPQPPPILTRQERIFRSTVHGVCNERFSKETSDGADS